MKEGVDTATLLYSFFLVFYSRILTYCLEKLNTSGFLVNWDTHPFFHSFLCIVNHGLPSETFRKHAICPGRGRAIGEVYHTRSFCKVHLCVCLLSVKEVSKLCITQLLGPQQNVWIPNIKAKYSIN